MLEMLTDTSNRLLDVSIGKETSNLTGQSQAHPGPHMSVSPVPPLPGEQNQTDVKHLQLFYPDTE
jgi:hypothetical protein